MAKAYKISVCNQLAAVVIALSAVIFQSCGHLETRDGRDGAVTKRTTFMGVTVRAVRKVPVTDAEFAKTVTRDVTEREETFDITTKEKTRTMFLWLAGASYSIALACVLAGIFTHGYKTFAAMAVGCIVTGTAFLTIMTTLHYLVYVLVALVVGLVIRMLYVLREKGIKPPTTEEEAA